MVFHHGHYRGQRAMLPRSPEQTVQGFTFSCRNCDQSQTDGVISPHSSLRHLAKQMNQLSLPRLSQGGGPVCPQGITQAL